MTQLPHLHAGSEELQVDSCLLCTEKVWRVVGKGGEGFGGEGGCTK